MPERSQEPHDPAEPAAPTTADDVSRPAPAAARRSNYELPTRKNTSLRNMLWALGLTMAVVIVVGIVFFGVGSDAEQEVPASSRTDVAESAQRAQEEAAFPVAVPQLDGQWQERSAQFTASGTPQWEIRYSSPQGELTTLVESTEVSAPMLSAALPGTTVEEERQIDGADCQVLSGSGPDGEQSSGIACQDDGWGVLVHGTGDPAELETLAAAAINSIRDGAMD